MGIGILRRFVTYLQRVTLVQEGGPTDGQLLECFNLQRDEMAFATLVQRHGPMVFGVCLRVLGNPSDAEDAFQATFLILVRKAGALRQPEQVGNGFMAWLIAPPWKLVVGSGVSSHERNR